MTALALTTGSFDPAVMAANQGALQAAFSAGSDAYDLPAGAMAYAGAVGHWSSGIPFRMRGRGRAITRLYPKNLAAPYRAIEFGLPAPDGGARGLRDFDLVLDPGQTGIHVQNDDQFNIDEVSVSGGDLGVHFRAAYAANITRLRCADTARHGLYLEGPCTANGLSLIQSGFFNCGFGTTGWAACRIEGGDGVFLERFNAEGNYIGLHASNVRGLVMTPYIERNAFAPIITDGACSGWRINGGWIAGETGKPQTIWNVQNLNGLTCDGVRFFNILIQVQRGTTANINILPTCSFDNASVTYV